MARTKKRVSWRVKLLLVVSSVVATLAILGIVEVVFRLAGIGAADASQTSRLRYQQVFLPIMQPAELSDGTEVFETVDSRLPYQWIRRKKPEGTLRVFTFGGSATAGLGYSPNVTFARHLERILKQACPGADVEIVNLGIVALSSKQVQHLVADVAERFSPDLVVVYSGNNEFLEIHAEKYAEAHATFASSTVDLLSNTNLYRALTQMVSGGPQAPSLAGEGMSNEDLRLSQRQIIKDIAMTEAEIATIVDQYEANIDAATQAALDREVPVLLMTVASNLKWRGREDLPDDWKTKLVGDTDGDDLDSKVLAALDNELAQPEIANRYELLFKRAIVREALRDLDGARQDYLDAMDADPHLRRALSVMNQRVGAIAERRGAMFLDTTELLAEHAEHGIVGFGEYYDYVHFTPKGVTIVGAAIFHEMQRQSMLPDLEEGFSTDQYIEQRLQAIANLERDPLAIDEWLGIGFDTGRITDRDLWKFDEMLLELDETLSKDPDNVQALVYRANANFFKPKGAAAAARDYEAALKLEPDAPEVRDNLERLRRERGARLE